MPPDGSEPLIKDSEVIITLGDSLLHGDSSFCVGLEGQSDVPVESKQRTRPSIYFCTVAVLIFFFTFFEYKKKLDSK